MGNQQEIDIAWLAGIFDGEGTITATKNYGTKHPNWNARKTEMSIANCDERVILRCLTILDGFGIRGYITKIERRIGMRQVAWRVGVSKLKDVKKLTALLIPHLTSKQEQATLLNKYVTSRLERAWLLGQTQPDGIHHKLTRRPISPEETQAIDELLKYNDRFSRSSTTAREGALAALLERKIQSGLMRKYKKSAEMTDSVATD